jgi:hypothetical protein
MTDEPGLRGDDGSDAQPPPLEELHTSDEEVGSIDPGRALRTSPYAVAAFVVSLIGVMPQGIVPLSFVPFPFGAGQISVILVAAIVPVGTVVLAFWLSGRGELEIVSSGGRIGGVGFCRAARGVALLTLLLLVGSIFSQFVIRNDSEFGPFGEGSDVVELDPPNFENFPGPDGPADPARPVEP